MGKKKKHSKVHQRGQNKPYEPESFTAEVRAEVAKLFSKKFTYDHDTENQWRLPPVESIFTTHQWQNSALQTLKTKLNETKGLLSDIDINQWHSHTQNMNRAGEVINEIKKHVNPELCTQAWCKFHEIVNTFPIVPWNLDGREAFTSLHICEAPGAFITSLNHYLVSTAYPHEWNWLGNTLNPYYEGNNHHQMIADDRFIFETCDQWYFGRDNTGNIMSKENLDGLVDICQGSTSHKHFHLITADGSIDCANNPGEQEVLTSPLHYCELVTALHLLAPHGSLVVKMFTLLEDVSVCMLYLINCVFDQVSVFKPATSKAGNSEVYIVATGYQGISQDYLDCLKLHFGSSKLENVLFPLECIPTSFLNQHLQCCTKFCDYQIGTIQMNLSSYGNLDDVFKNHIEDLRHCCSLEYIERYYVQQISLHQRIVAGYQHVSDINKSRDIRVFETRYGHNIFFQPRGSKKGHYKRMKLRRKHEGSYTQRLELLHLPWEQKVLKIEKFILPHNETRSLNCQYEVDVDFTDWQITIGKAFPTVCNSCFCDVSLLELYHEMCSHIKECQNVSVHIPDTLACHLQECASMGFECSPASHDGYLKKFYIEESQNIVECGVADDVFQIVFFNGPSHCAEHDLLTHQISVDELKTRFQKLSEGDWIVLPMPCPVTRFNAGLIFLINTLFMKIHLITSTDCALVYVVAEHCLGAQRLERVIRHLNLIQQLQCSGENQVLESVPIYFLYEASFYNYMCFVVEMFIKARINHLLDNVKSNK